MFTTADGKMKFPLIKIKDNHTGDTHIFGTDNHDFLRISDDGKCLYYNNWQNMCGSEDGTFTFVSENEYDDVFTYVDMAFIDDLIKLAKKHDIEQEKFHKALEEFLDKMEREESD